MDPPGLLAHLPYARGVLFEGHEMDVAHLGDRVAQLLVDGALGELAARDVRDRQVQDRRGGGRREDLVAIAQQDDDVGLKPGEGVGKAGQVEFMKDVALKHAIEAEKFAFLMVPLLAD